MLKWKLLIKTLPLVVCVVVVALVRDYVLRVPGVIEFSEVSPLLAAVALIVGFMLAGVLADYKESEKIPGEIATTLETIGDTVRTVITLNQQSDVSKFESQFCELVATIDDWFVRRVSVAQCYGKLEEFRGVVETMHSAAGVNYAIRGLAEMHNLRKLITRVDVISRTSFIPIGYALLELLVATTLGLLLISNYKTPIAEYFLISLFSLIYIYLLRLIRDIDAPFAYSASTNVSSSAEIDPYPLREYRKRLEGLQRTKSD
jgi:hypothetical protein